MTQQNIAGETGALGSSGDLNVYTVPGSAIVTPYSATVAFDGTGAAGAFIPCLTFKTQTGAIIARCPAPEVAAGDTAEVSWFPHVAPPASPPTSREILDTSGGLAIPGHTEASIAWGAKLSGDDLLDLSVLYEAAFVTAGVYAISVTIQCQTNMPNGTGYYAAIEGSAGQVHIAQSVTATTADPQPFAALTFVTYMAAGDFLTVSVYNYAAVPATFATYTTYVQRIS